MSMKKSRPSKLLFLFNSMSLNVLRESQKTHVTMLIQALLTKRELERIKNFNSLKYLQLGASMTSESTIAQSYPTFLDLF